LWTGFLATRAEGGALFPVQRLDTILRVAICIGLARAEGFAMNGDVLLGICLVGCFWVFLCDPTITARKTISLGFSALVENHDWDVGKINRCVLWSIVLSLLTCL
jgi:hypothetical protein